MNWRENPNQLAWKMLAYIEKCNRDVPYTELEDRATGNGIDIDTLEASLALLHRFNKIKQRVKAGDIVYCIAERKQPQARVHSVSMEAYQKACEESPWCYDDEGKLIMPFPEIDMSWLFLKGEDLARYKAESKGRRYVPKKRYEYKRD